VRPGSSTIPGALGRNSAALRDLIDGAVTEPRGRTLEVPGQSERGGDEAQPQHPKARIRERSVLTKRLLIGTVVAASSCLLGAAGPTPTRRAVAVTAILAVGAGADVTSVDAAASTGCTRRVVIGHVPGHLNPVLVLRCVPPHRSGIR
jgi:hypothetical protein